MDFSKHRRYQTIKLKDIEGKEEEFKFESIGAKYLPNLFTIMNRFKGIDEKSDGDEVINKLDKETVDNIMEMIIETVKKSYPEASQDDAEQFASTHFIEMMPVVINLNSPKK